jgi:hypothetical protein
MRQDLTFSLKRLFHPDLVANFKVLILVCTLIKALAVVVVVSGAWLAISQISNLSWLSYHANFSATF